jgi:cytidylate kinase
MLATRPIVITVSRQLGSGGSYLGKQVAQRLGYAYIDRQILQQAAKALGVEEAMIEAREERLESFWKYLLTVFAMGPPGATYTPPPHMISDAELIETERRLICELATRGPSVVLGRGAFHLLRGKVRLVNVFAHAPLEFRVERVMSIYHAKSRDEAVRMIERSDEGRRRYIRTFTGLDWFDARNYHLTIDTGVIDFATAEELITSAVERLHPENTWPWVNEPV